MTVRIPFLCAIVAKSVILKESCAWDLFHANFADKRRFYFLPTED
jgi:hypothetical protein